MDNSKSYHHYQHIKTYSSSALRRNSLVFGIIMVGLQIGLSLVYGFLINVQHVQLNISSVVVTIGLAILVIAGNHQYIIGFGLLFGYTRKLLWSGIGFTFFITALCIEVYPLINDFWTKTHLQGNNANIPDFSFDKKSYNIMLSNR